MAMTTPEFTNKHTKVMALGLAVDATQHKLYYGSMCGPAISCKSIWASLCADKAKNTYVVGWHYENFNGQPPIKTVNQTLPGSSYTHLVCLSHSNNLILAIEPGAAGVTKSTDRAALLAPHMPTVLAKFTAILNQQTNVPVLPAWSATLWDQATTKTDAITQLLSYGDCVGGWLIDLKFDWLALLSELLANHQLMLTS